MEQQTEQQRIVELDCNRRYDASLANALRAVTRNR